MHRPRVRPRRTHVALALALALAACGGPGGGGGPDPQPGPQGFTALAQFPSPEARDGDDFGTGLALRGDLLVVGAPYAAGSSTSGTGTGAAWPFLLGATPSVGDRIVDPTGMNDDAFGTAVAIDGAYTFVGAPFTDGIRGSVFVHRREGDGFSPVGTLAEPTPSTGTAFGNRIAAHGGRVLVATPGRTDGPGRRGVVHVFELEGADFVHRQVLRIPEGVADDSLFGRFGAAVAIHDDVAVVASTATHRAYVYEYAAGTWTHVATLGGAAEHVERQYGRSVAIADGVIFVGAPAGQAPEPEDGRVYVYTRTSTTWTQAYRFSSENAVAGEYGYALATDGTRLVVGAPTVASGGVSGAGAAFVYDLDGSQVLTGQQLTAISPSSDLRFGTVVAIDVTWIAVAGPRRAGAGGRPPGEVVVFQR